MIEWLSEGMKGLCFSSFLGIVETGGDSFGVVVGVGEYEAFFLI